MNRRLLIFGGGATALIIITVIVVFIVLSNQYHPKNTVDAFNEAIEGKDVDSLKELIVTDEKDAEINEASLSAFIHYLQANNESNQVIKKSLKKQLDNEDFTTSNEQVSLIEAGKTMGIFSNYKIKVKTVNLTIKGLDEDDQISLTIDGFEDKLSEVDNEEDLYGPLLPGEYDIEATIKNKLGTFDEEKKVDVWGNTDVSFLMDSESLVRKNKNIQKDIIQAANAFNEDMSVYVTSGFEVDSFVNATEDLKDELSAFDYNFDSIKDYVEKIESEFLEATINMDEFDITQFDGEWAAEVTMFVSYDEMIKLKEEDTEDLSYTELRILSLIFDKESDRWMVDDYNIEPFHQDDIDNWENKVEIDIDDSTNYEWSDEESFI